MFASDDRLVCFAECRMQNGLYGQRYQCEASVMRARSLRKDRTDWFSSL